MAQVYTGSGFFGGGEVGKGILAPRTRRFETEIDNDVKEAYTSEFLRTYQREPSEDEIRFLYNTRKRFPEVK
jgi:hypothetical protein